MEGGVWGVGLRTSRAQLRRPRRQHLARRGALAAVFADLATVEIKDEQADGGREIAVPALGVNRSDQVGERHVAPARDFLQSLPERVFKADAGLVTGDDDGAFDYRRFHRLSPVSIRC